MSLPLSCLSIILVGVIVVPAIKAAPSLHVFLDKLGLDALELCSGQDAQQLPAEVESFFDASVSGVALIDILLLELLGKLCKQFVVIGEGCLAEYGHELLCLLAS